MTTITITTTTTTRSKKGETIAQEKKHAAAVNVRLKVTPEACCV
jgi:hypothetical protein